MILNLFFELSLSCLSFIFSSIWLQQDRVPLFWSKKRPFFVRFQNDVKSSIFWLLQLYFVTHFLVQIVICPPFFGRKLPKRVYFGRFWTEYAHPVMQSCNQHSGSHFNLLQNVVWKINSFMQVCNQVKIIFKHNCTVDHISIWHKMQCGKSIPN